MRPVILLGLGLPDLLTLELETHRLPPPMYQGGHLCTLLNNAQTLLPPLSFPIPSMEDGSAESGRLAGSTGSVDPGSTGSARGPDMAAVTGQAGHSTGPVMGGEGASQPGLGFQAESRA